MKEHIICPKCGSHNITRMDGDGAIERFGNNIMIDIAPETCLCNDCKQIFHTEPFNTDFANDAEDESANDEQGGVHIAITQTPTDPETGTVYHIYHVWDTANSTYRAGSAIFKIESTDSDDVKISCCSGNEKHFAKISPNDDCMFTFSGDGGSDNETSYYCMHFNSDSQAQAFAELQIDINDGGKAMLTEQNSIFPEFYLVIFKTDINDKSYKKIRVVKNIIKGRLDALASDAIQFKIIKKKTDGLWICALKDDNAVHTFFLKMCDLEVIIIDGSATFTLKLLKSVSEANDYIKTLSDPQESIEEDDDWNDIEDAGDLYPHERITEW